MIALILHGPTGLPLAAYLWWAAFSIVLSFIDLAVRRLPTRLNYAAVGGLLTALLIDAQVTHHWQPGIRAVFGALLTAGLAAACAVAMPTMVHWGDVRYALAVGAAAAWLGWIALYGAIFVATLMAALTGIGLLVLRRASLSTQLPQGPFLYAGTLTVVALLASSGAGHR